MFFQINIHHLPQVTKLFYFSITTKYQDVRGGTTNQDVAGGMEVQGEVQLHDGTITQHKHLAGGRGEKDKDGAGGREEQGKAKLHGGLYNQIKYVAVGLEEQEQGGSP